MGDQGEEEEGEPCTQLSGTSIDVIDPDKGRDVQQEHEAPFSRRQMFCMWLSMFTQGVQITLSYTLAAYMVRRLMGPDASEQAVGQLTGILAAAGFFSRFLVAYAWGMASDRLGRKVVVQIGMLAGILDIVAFGGFHRYALVLTSRFVLGLFASVNVGVRSMGGDVKAVSEKTRVAAATSLAWSIGSIMGFFIGGEMSEPCTRYSASLPFCGPGGLFRERPYFLPCLFAGAVNTLGLIFNSLFLEETLPHLKGRTHSWPALWRPRYTLLPESDSPRSTPRNPNPQAYPRPATPQTPSESAYVEGRTNTGNHAEMPSGNHAERPSSNAGLSKPAEFGILGDPAGASCVGRSSDELAAAKKVGRFDSASSATSLSETWGRPGEGKAPALSDNGVELAVLAADRDELSCDSVSQGSASGQTGLEAIGNGVASSAGPLDVETDVAMRATDTAGPAYYGIGDYADGVSQEAGSAACARGVTPPGKTILLAFDVLPPDCGEGCTPPHAPSPTWAEPWREMHPRDHHGGYDDRNGLPYPERNGPDEGYVPHFPNIGESGTDRASPPRAHREGQLEPGSANGYALSGLDAPQTLAVADISSGANAGRVWEHAGRGPGSAGDPGRTSGFATWASGPSSDNDRAWAACGRGGGSAGHPGRASGFANSASGPSRDAERAWAAGGRGGGSMGQPGRTSGFANSASGPSGDADRAWAATDGDMGPETDVCQAWGSAHGTWRVFSAEEVGAAGKEKAVDDVAWFRQRRVLQVLAGSGMLTLLWCYLDELTPIYVSAGLDKGGLGMALSTFTNANVFSGGVLVLFTLFVYPQYSKRVGPLRACLVGMVAAVPAILLIPAASLVAPDHPLLEECAVLHLRGHHAACAVQDVHIHRIHGDHKYRRATLSDWGCERHDSNAGQFRPLCRASPEREHVGFECVTRVSEACIPGVRGCCARLCGCTNCVRAAESARQII